MTVPQRLFASELNTLTVHAYDFYQEFYSGFWPVVWGIPLVIYVILTLGRMIQKMLRDVIN